MINVDLQQLIQALDTETRRDLERAAESCVSRGGSKVLVEDLLLGLLERPQLAMVGSRRASRAGLDTAQAFAVAFDFAVTHC